jgi:transposase-like protein
VDVTDRKWARKVAKRLGIIRHAEENGNVALTCRYFGIPAESYYKWLRRYEEFGVEGLRDRSTRPHSCPNAINEEVVAKILYLSQNYRRAVACSSMSSSFLHLPALGGGAISTPQSMTALASGF